MGENQVFSTPWREVQKFLTVNIGVRSGNMCVGFGTQSEILMWNIKNLIFHPHLVRNRGDSLGFDFGQPVRDSPLTCHASGQSRTGGCDREGKVVTCILNYLLPQIFFGGWWSGRAKTPRHNSMTKHFQRRPTESFCSFPFGDKSAFEPIKAKCTSSPSRPHLVQHPS